MIDLLAHAEGYAARGWLPFPCKVNGKAPATRSGLYAGTDDLVTVRRYWRQHPDYNIGLNCGGSGLFVVDLDIKPEAGPPGMSAWLELCDAHGCEWTETYCVNTPRGGCHVYWWSNVGLRTTTGELAINIDTRALGGYVIAAGSVVDGQEYEHWGADEPKEVPSWLADRFRPRERTVSQVLATARTDIRNSSADQRERSLQGLVDQVLDALEGERNRVLNWAYHSAVNVHNWPDDFKEAARARLFAAGVANGLTEREVRDTLRLKGR